MNGRSEWGCAMDESLWGKGVKEIFMKKRAKPSIRMMAVIVAGMLIICGATACQPTPENDAVQKKDGDVLMDTINNSSQNNGEKYAAPDQWEESMTLLGGKVHAKINAPITVPEVTSFPSIRIEPDKFHIEDFRVVEKLFFPNCTYYSLDAPQTKEELEQLIVMTQKSINDPTSNFNTGNLNDEDYQRVLQDKQSQIEMWQQQYEEAPYAADLPPMEVTEEQFNQDDLYLWMKAVSSDNILKAHISMNATSEENNRYNAIDVMLYPRDPSDTSHYEYRKIGDNEYLLPPLMKISEEDAIQTAIATINSLGIEDMQYSYCLQISEGDKEEYQVYFTKTYYGVPSNYAANGGETNEYVFDYAEEVIRISVNDDGIIGIMWDSPSKEAEILSENVELLGFSQIQEIARKQLEHRFAWQEGEENVAEKRVNVNDIKLGMMRISMPNMVDEYMVIPVWDFYGYFEEVYPAEFAEELQREANSDGEVVVPNYTGITAGSSLFTINAIDGSIINRN